LFLFRGKASLINKFRYVPVMTMGTISQSVQEFRGHGSLGALEAADLLVGIADVSCTI